MKKTIISRENIEALTTIISAAQGRATTRTITASQMVDACESVTKQLGISKKTMEGIKIHCDLNAQHMPSSYTYTAEATQFDAHYTKGSWVLDGVIRSYLMQRSTSNTNVILTDAAKEAILTRLSTMRV